MFSHLFTACPSQTNSILYSGTLFAALDGTAPSATGDGCQSDVLYLPTNWILANDNSVSQDVIGAYPWGVDFMIVGDGAAYWTSQLGGGAAGLDDVLNSADGGYSVNGCDVGLSGGILIQCTSSQQCALCPTGTYSSISGRGLNCCW